MISVLIAPNAFKGSFSAVQIADLFADAVSSFMCERARAVRIERVPLADGGDGTVESLHVAGLGILCHHPVSGALGERRLANWLARGNEAVVEMASACGIAGLSENLLDPLRSGSAGLGQVIAHVLEMRIFSQVFVGVGGSASTDGGSGALSAMGAVFFDESGNAVTPAGGGSLFQIHDCDLSGLARLCGNTRLVVLTDVSTPLCGATGAARTFGPQKGASASQVELLEQALAHFADVLESRSSKHLRNRAGAGAAGGTAFGLACAAGAELAPGFEQISQMVRLQEKIHAADLVISGEGRVDAGTFYGKVTGSLFELCRAHKKPLLVVAGSIDASCSLPADSKLLIKAAGQGGLAGATQIQQALTELLNELDGLSKTDLD